MCTEQQTEYFKIKSHLDAGLRFRNFNFHYTTGQNFLEFRFYKTCSGKVKCPLVEGFFLAQCKFTM